MHVVRYCETATEMLRELQRSKKLLPPYNEEAMRRVIQESNDITARMTEQTQRHRTVSGAAGAGSLPTELMPALLLEVQAVHFNKRCALSYLHERLQRVKAGWWATSGVLSAESSAAHQELAANLAAHERRFFDDYNALLSDYIASSEVVVTAELQPPRSVWVDVAVLRSIGRIEGADGTPIELRAGNRKRMRRIDAENLIRQGIVQITD